MKLSEQLEQDQDSGDFGNVLSGYSERAKHLEDSLKYINSYLEGVDELVSDGANFSSSGLKNDINKYNL